MNIKKIPESQGWIQRLGEWAVRQHTFMPRMIDLEVSRVCNLNCPACMRRADTSLSHGEEKFCSLQKFKDIYSQIPTLGTLNFMGDGEPLCNPELNNIIEYAASKGVYTVITSNLGMMSMSDLTRWEQNKVYRIHASIDACTPTLYESMRVGADWGTMVRNATAIGRSSIPLVINMVLTKKNIYQMPDMVYFAKSVGAREITFLMPICAYGPDEDIRPDDSLANVAIFRDTQKACLDAGVRWIFPLTLSTCFRRFSFPFIRPEISIEGDLWACCYSLGRGDTWVFGEKIHIEPGTYNMGNMFDLGFKRVWYSDKYKALREEYINTELPKGTVLSREDYILKVRTLDTRRYFAHCEICPARWGIACS